MTALCHDRLLYLEETRKTGIGKALALQVPQALVLKPYAAPTDIAAGTSPPPAPTAPPTGTVNAVSTGPPVPATGSGTAGGRVPPLGFLLVALGAACFGVGIRGRRADCP